MSDIITNLITILEPYLEIVQIVLAVVISFVIFSIIIRLIRRRLLKKASSKKQQSNVTVFLDLLKYIFVFLLIIVVFSTYYGRWGELSFIAGLLTVALGWALQKPISGVVAWLIIITKRSIHIGDRVIISGLTGDITDITLTHIFLDEVGGTIDGEEQSRRTIMLPTSLIFEQQIINYTHSDDYILDEVSASITYESDLDHAEKLMKDAVKLVMSRIDEKFPKKLKKEPWTRLNFKDSGIEIKVRYFTIATRRNRISTDIRRKIYHLIKKSKDVEFAYPHAEVLLRNK
jgi:small-conductance mechanosensitive channel